MCKSEARWSGNGDDRLLRGDRLHVFPCDVITSLDFSRAVLLCIVARLISIKIWLYVMGFTVLVLLVVPNLTYVARVKSPSANQRLYRFR